MNKVTVSGIEKDSRKFWNRWDDKDWLTLGETPQVWET